MSEEALVVISGALEAFVVAFAAGQKVLIS
jgi:hypothetical protein